MQPDAPGTRIVAVEGPDDAEAPVKGLSLVDGMAVLELVGSGMVGVPGTAERLFAALHAAKVSVTMISQGSSEHSICCVIRDDQHVLARQAEAVAVTDTDQRALRCHRIDEGFR